MTRRPKVNRGLGAGRLFLAAAMALPGLFSAAAQDAASVEFVTTQLTDTIHLIVSVPANAGNLAVSAGEDGILIVDDQMLPRAPKLKEALGKIQKGKIDFVVNSHYHYDHAGGNPVFGLEAAIVAHENVRMRLLEGREAGARFSATPFPAEALPVVTFGESVTLHWNDETIDVIHFPSPAHTDGDSVIYFRDSNVIHTGDQYINLGSYPYIDRDVGGSARGVRDNTARILEMIDDETKIIPGHGPLATKADLQAFHDLVAETIELIESDKSSGKSLEEIQSVGLPAKYAEYGKAGFISEAAWIEAVYAGADD